MESPISDKPGIDYFCSKNSSRLRITLGTLNRQIQCIVLGVPNTKCCHFLDNGSCRA